MIARFNGNVVPFADDATSTNRTVFGGTTQSDLIDDNLNTNFKKGWEIVGLNDNPTREDFNAMGYTLGALTAYLYEMGIAEWNDKQKYKEHSITIGSDGNIYRSLVGTEEIPNVNNNPTLAGSLSWASFLPDRIGLIDYGYVAKSYHIVAFGGEFNRADYPKLWAYLQANPTLVKTQAQWQTEATANNGICGFFSDGNGTTTFRVPNLDKAFLRPDSRTIASYQNDEFKSHAHAIVAPTSIAASAGSTGIILASTGVANYSTSASGGTETRPKNIAVLPLIVAK